MHNIEMTYDPSDTPNMDDICTLRRSNPKDTDEVLFKVRCNYGWIYVVRKNYRTKKPGERL